MDVKKSHKSHMTRTVALWLCLCLGLVPLLSACGNIQTADGVAIPQGMQDATGNGTGYHLFVPSDWRIDHSTGVTIATYSTATLLFATFPTTRDMDAYWNDSRAEIEAMFESDFSLTTEGEQVLFGGTGALCYRFSGIYADADGDGKKDPYGVTQYVCRRSTQMYVLTYLAPEEDYEQYTTVLEKVVSDFLFTDEGHTPEEQPATPGESTGTPPQGMKEITLDAIHGFHLFVPQEWVADLQNGTVSAYVSDTDRTSISLVWNYPTEADTLPAHFTYLEETYKEQLPNYTLLKRDEKIQATQGGLDGLCYEFTATHQGKVLHFYQVLFVRGALIYTYTYTAEESLYTPHRAEADAILGSIVFK